MQSLEFAEALERVVITANLQTLAESMPFMVRTDNSGIPLDIQQQMNAAIMDTRAGLVSIRSDELAESIAGQFGLFEIMSDEHLFHAQGMLRGQTAHARADAATRAIWESARHMVVLADVTRSTLVAGRGVATDDLAGTEVVLVREDTLSLEDVTTLIESFGTLYQDVCRLFGEQETLSIHFLDSGSNFTFGFKGLGSAINAISDGLFRLYREWRFRDYRLNDERREEARGQFSFLGDIRVAEEEGIIEPGEADMLRERAKRGLFALFDLNAVPRAALQRDDQTVRLLIESQTQLALPPADDVAEEGDGTEEVDDD